MDRSPLLSSPQPIQEYERPSLFEEVSDILRLGMPIFVSMVSWVAIKSTDTALLGHVGTRFLEASALSDLWTSSTGIFIQGRVLSMFCGQAIGAGNKPLAGIWLQVSLAVLFAIAIPVITLWAFTSYFLQLFGSSQQLSADAGTYAQILLLCIPARIAYSQLSQYFQAQRIMFPEVIAAMVAMSLNLVGGLLFVLGIPIPGWKGYGFLACPIVTVTTEYVQFGLFWIISCAVYRLHTDCWPTNGWSMTNITRERLVIYLRMYIPAALAIASDFWRLSAIGAMAATLGEVELAVFNSSYRVLWMCLIFIGSLGAAVAIKLGIALGEGKTREATRVSTIGIGMACVILGGLSVIVYSFPRALGSIFSSDPAILNGFEDNRLPLAGMMFFMNLSVMLERIPLSMGRTRIVLVLGLVGSWVGQVPAVLLLTKFWRDDLVAVYTGVAAGYALLCICYLVVILTSDWNYYAKQAAIRSEVRIVVGTVEDEESKPLVATVSLTD